MTSIESHLPLPDYEKPPVIEVVHGIQFTPPPGLHTAAIGAFWERTLRGDYPIVQEAPPLPHMIEQVGDGQETIEVSFQHPMPRMQFIAKDACWLVQMQRDRVLLNWRKLKPSDEYPRFPVVVERFRELRDAYAEFLAGMGLELPPVDQLELTYINHIPAGEKWETLVDVGRVFQDIRWDGDHAILGDPESLNWTMNFRLPDGCGRLHVAVKSAARKDSGERVFLCDLTARGVPTGSNEDAYGAWFELAREWIVRGFTDLTAEEIQKDVWRRIV